MNQLNNNLLEYSKKTTQTPNSKSYKPILPMLLGGISFAVCFVVSQESLLQYEFSNLFLLPLFTGILLFIQSVFTSKVHGMSPIIIGGFYYLRNVIAPLILVLDGYKSKFMLIGYNDINSAIFIMSYETLAVFIAIILMCSGFKQLSKKKRYSGVVLGNFVYVAAIICGIGISFFSLFNSLELRNSFYSIFTSNFYEVGNDIIAGGSSKALYNGGKVLIDSLRLVVPATIIVHLRKRYDSSRKIVYLSVIIAVLQVFFMTDGNAYILILVIVQLILIHRLHPQFRRELFLMIAGFGAAAAFLMAVHRFLLSSSAYSSSLSLFVQSYFGGICDVAGIFRLTRSNLIEHFFVDFYSAVPFRGTLFGYSGNDILTVELFNSVNRAHSQILPTVAESYYFFGYLLSPLFSVIFVMIGITFEKKAKSQDHYLYYILDLLICFVACVCPVAYDMRIFVTYCLNKFLFMWIFIRLSKSTMSYIIESKNMEES